MSAKSGPWWQDAVTYQIYPRSFADNNGDGVGDLPGITAHLPYVRDLGVDAIWLTPFYRSPMADHGYDVADYLDVDPLFGSMDDFTTLLDTAHELGLKVIVDLVPNHTSSEHEWFKDALAGGPKRDWYIFRPPKEDGSPPNNWTSVFGGPAWTLEETSGEYYLHLFAPEQPDLNWRNPEVGDAWADILRFWLERGVDGFRIDVAHGLFKDEQLRDNPPPPKAKPGTEHLMSVGSKYTWDQPEVLAVYERWRRITDSFADRMMVGEVFLLDLSAITKYVSPTRLHQAFNFLVMSTPFDAAEWKDTLSKAIGAFGDCATWVLSNHDLVRHTTRYGGGLAGQARARAATTVLLALPGAPYLYEGEELGLEQSVVPPELRQDPIWFNSGKTVEGRDGCRTPIPWTAAGAGHGFTTGTPWLPFGADATTRAVDVEEGDQDSMLEYYRSLLATRRSLRDDLGSEVTWRESPKGTLVFERRYGDSQLLTCALNTSSATQEVQVRGTDAQLVVSSAPAQLTDIGCKVPTDAAVWVLTALDEAH